MTETGVLHVDGRQPVSAAAVEEILRLCDRAEDGELTGAAIVQVTGVPDPAWARELNVGLISKWERALRRLERAPVPTVAIASGDCSGIALDVLLATDVRVAVRGARLIPSRHGDATWPGMALYRLARHATGGPVRRAALLGGPIDAADAARAGLVDEVVDDADTAVQAIARLASGIAGTELAIRRQLLLDAGHTRFEDALGSHLAACDRALRREAEVGTP